MRNIAIFDLDGCLSDDEHRRHWLPTSLPAQPSDYDAYNELCHLDKPMNQPEWVRCGVGMKRIVITARPERLSARTGGWILDNFGGQFCLRMRPDGDMRPSPELKVALAEEAGITPDQVAVAYDDRSDVLAAYAKWGVPKDRLRLMNKEGCKPYSRKREVADILQEMALTFRERNAVYGDNYKMVAKLVKVLFPDGVPPELVVTDQWHLFELKLVKLSRFAISNLTHVDSVHDDAVYSAMIESILSEGE